MGGGSSLAVPEQRTQGRQRPEVAWGLLSLAGEEAGRARLCGTHQLQNTKSEKKGGRRFPTENGGRGVLSQLEKTKDAVTELQHLRVNCGS